MFATIWEVTKSNLGLEIGYPHRFFMVFLSPSSKMLVYYHKLGHGHFLPHLYQFIIRPRKSGIESFFFNYWN
jgi:hypothetical protein